MAFGFGIVRGMAITLRHFFETYGSDLQHLGRATDEKSLAQRQSVRGKGIFTVQYPEETVKVSETFRFLPFLLYEPAIDEKTGQPVIDPATGKEAWGYERCTSCGICAKVCPPQCIWIVRAKSPEGKPLTRCSEFYIDTDVCMNCGFCAEFCPFDAIKMDHDFELADYERHLSHIYDYDRLMKSTTYYQTIRPNDYAYEEANLTKERQASKAKKVAATAAASASAPAAQKPS
jgi:NADH-quinone oxidoreductase subunit I